MGLLDRLNSKDRAGSNNISGDNTIIKSQKTVRCQMKELLGREFRLVKDGLDPDEVASFLEIALGSSEAALKRLEYFSSLEQRSKVLEAMIAETSLLVESIKRQAEREAEAEKSQIIQDARRKANETLALVRERCLPPIKDANSIILGAIAKAGETEQMAFQKAKETMSMGVEALQRDIQNMFEPGRGEPEPPPPLERFAEELPNLKPQAVDVPSNGGESETLQADEQVIDLAELLKSENLLSQIQAVDIPSNGGERKTSPANEQVVDLAKLLGGENTFDYSLETQLANFEFDEKKEPINREAQATTGLKGSNALMYSGEVILEIPQGIGQAWIRQLRQRLNTTPGVHIQLEAGNGKGGSMVTLLLDKPIALASILLEMPSVKEVIEGQKTAGLSDSLTYGQKHSNPGDRQQTILTLVLNKDTTDLPAR